jgi:hypothetical protein
MLPTRPAWHPLLIIVFAPSGKREDYVALLDPSQINWFRESQKTSLVAIGLQKSYAKTKVGEFCTGMMFIDSVDGC